MQLRLGMALPGLGCTITKRQIASLIFIFNFTTDTFASLLYMDKYSDCFKSETSEPFFELDGDGYNVLAKGGEAYDAFNCIMNFKSLNEDRLCLNFNSYDSSNCKVKLVVFDSSTASGRSLVKYSCKDVPKSICSTNKYITLKLEKTLLGKSGYSFSLDVRERTESDAFADGLDAFIMSIGVIIAIIVGVIILVVIIAVIVIYCCCKKKRHRGSTYRHPSNKPGTTAQTHVPLEPSAPPFQAEPEFHGYHGDQGYPPPAYTEEPPPYTPTSPAS